jgi:hypothetical protein
MHFITARRSLSCALLCLTLTSHATTVQRCEDSTGHITFTSLGCPAGQQMQAQKAFNAAPGSHIPLLPPANHLEDAVPRSGPGRNRPTAITVVGTREDGCGNRLTAEQRRRAIINQRTLPGMNRSEVESALGKPDKITSRNGETRYIYKEKKGRSSQVTFDANDCVKGKS